MSDRALSGEVAPAIGLAAGIVPAATLLPALRPRQGWQSAAYRAAALAPAAAILAFCALGAMAWTADPAAIDPAAILQPPSLAHPAGTDALGRDELARLIQGGAATLLVAIPACLFSFVIGTAYGIAAALAPRLVGAALMRLLDAVLALPALVLLIALAALLELNTASLILLLSCVAWAPLARLARNEAVALRGRDYVLAAQQMGALRGHLARVHLLPVMRPVLLVNATLLLGDCIALISALGFLGLGVQPPRTSWGQLLQDGLLLVDLRPWWLIAPPGLLIAASLLATSLAGGALLPRRAAA
jgi:peptide/nickel transport system permease protein